MKNLLTLVICLFLVPAGLIGQVIYTDHFDNEEPSFTGGGGFIHGETASEWTITAETQTGPFSPFTYQPHDPSLGMTTVVDASGNNKVFVRAKASVIGTQLRLDLQDTMNLATTQASLTQTLTTDFQVLEYDFSGGFVDLAFGGTGCTTGPCNVDPTAISNLLFFPNPETGFAGSIVIDFIAFGSPPDTVITSDIFQDHFDDDSAANSFSFIGPGYTVSQQGSDVVISGDGTTGQWDPLTYLFLNRAAMDTFDIDITGNNKLFVKVKSSIPNTAFRIDVQDIDGFVSTSGSITKIVDTSYSVLEYDFTGVLSDLGFGGTPCTESTAPCTVDGTRIADLLFFIEPGVGGYPGELSIDYLSFGVPLETPGPPAELTYQDHFNNEELEYTSPQAGFTTTESGSELLIEGDGTSAPFSPVSYVFHDKADGSDIFVNMAPGANKLFVKAKVDSGSVPMRIDLIDTANFHTTLPSLTRVLSEEYEVYEFNFEGQYTDAGYGGTACESGPCAVDLSAITQALIFLDPIQGGFSGQVAIDFISIGQPLGEDAGPTGITGYGDQMDDNTALFITTPGGFSSVVAEDVWTLTGDGTAGAFAAISYTTHDELGENTLIDVAGSDSKLLVRAKASELNTQLRIDVQDNQGFVSNLTALSVILDTAYATYELDFTNSYQDGAFGGSPCTVQPCAVDAERISALLVYINPELGAYNGTVDIDWISFGAPLTSVSNLEQISPVGNFKMYPNPAKNRISLAYQLSESVDLKWEIISVMGQSIQQSPYIRRLPGNHTEYIGIGQLPTGMYILRLKADGRLVASDHLIKY